MVDVQSAGVTDWQPRRVEVQDLRHALRMGRQDCRRAPLFALVFGGIYVLGGWGLIWALSAAGENGGAKFDHGSGGMMRLRAA